MIKNGKIIKFDGDERWLSNMVTTQPFEYEGIVYHSTENAYQASKCIDESEKIYISQLTSYDSKKYHKNIIRKIGINVYKNKVLNPSFEQRKIDIMYDVNCLKYKQHKYKTLLLSTGNMDIIEGNTWNDQFWGMSLDNDFNIIKGHNNLGKVLMRIRTELLSGNL